MQSGDVTRLLAAAGSGDRAAFDASIGRSTPSCAAWPRRRCAGRAGDTLQPTALVNEAYLRLAPGREWETAPFLRRRRGDAAHSRGSCAPPAGRKRGADYERVTLTGSRLPTRRDWQDVLDRRRARAASGRAAAARRPGQAAVLRRAVDRGRRSGAARFPRRPPSATGPLRAPGCMEQIGPRRRRERSRPNRPLFDACLDAASDRSARRSWTRVRSSAVAACYAACSRF